MIHIMAVSLESAKKYKVYGTYDNNRIGLIMATPLTGPPSKWGAALKDEIREKSQDPKKPFIVLVEDRTKEFVVGDSSQFSFEEVLEGRSMLYHSLDWYFSMQGVGQIISDKAIERFMIRGGGEGQRIERKQDDKGRTVYSVDWSGLNGGHKGVLMCVAGAMMQPLSLRFLDAMYGSMDDDEDDTPEHMRSWTAITKGVHETRVKKWDKFYEK